MVPSSKVYFLLMLGIAIAPTLAIFLSIPTSIAVTLLYYLILLW